MRAIELNDKLREAVELLKNTKSKKRESGAKRLRKLSNEEAGPYLLDALKKEMEELLREMKLNPKRFVHFSLFGKKPKPYNGPPRKKREDEGI